MRNTPKFKRAFVIPDIHFPYQDKKALEVVKKIIKGDPPDRIIQVGDLIDAYPISKYSKDPDKSSGTTFQRELNEAKDFIKFLAKIAPVTILNGNHEERLLKYLKEKAPGLYGVDVLTIENLLEIDNKRTFYQDYTNLGKLFVHHGDRWSKSGSAESGATARSIVAKAGLSVMLGHIHRLAEYHRSQRGGDLSGYEIGCLCCKAAEYVSDPNWQHGFAHVEYQDTGSKSFNVTLLKIQSTSKDKYCIYKGKVFTS